MIDQLMFAKIKQEGLDDGVKVINDNRAMWGNVYIIRRSYENEKPNFDIYVNNIAVQNIVPAIENTVAALKDFLKNPYLVSWHYIIKGNTLEITHRYNITTKGD